MSLHSPAPPAAPDPLFDLAEAPSVVLNLGRGVDSTAMLARLVLEPALRWFPLERFVVITAVVGPDDEYREIQDYTERYLFPLLTQASVRVVQLARKGPRTLDGYLVLSDTRAPRTMVTDVPWSLYSEMINNATVPQVNPKRRQCSDKAKHWALDRWIHDTIGPRPFEQLMGFEVDEQDRIETDRDHATQWRTPRHPLSDWGWNRQACLDYLRGLFGVEWPRSCCSYCPFQGGSERKEPALVQRWRSDPQAAMRALTMELNALYFNENASLFKSRSALEIAARHGLTDLVERCRQQLDAGPWALYLVRRVYHAPAAGWRSVAVEEAGSHEQMTARLRARAGSEHLELDTGRHGIPKAYRLRRGEGYPAREQFLVAAPQLAVAKERDGFAKLWTRLSGVGQIPQE